MQQTNRPQSRGMGPTLGGIGPVQARPMGGMAGVPPGTSTGFRPQSGAGLGPVTGAPPGTAMRRTAMGTRQGTAQQSQIPGVGLVSDVKVTTNRPMTQQGIGGLKTGKVGPGRQIYDKSYFMGELRRRISELQGELNQFNNEISEITNDAGLYQTLEKRYDQLIKTVRNLEGDLADHNLATDKQRTDTRPEEVHHMFMLMKQQNDMQRSEVDQIFLEKRSHEEEIQKITAETLVIQRAAEERLNELHPDQRREYEDLREEQEWLGHQLGGTRQDLDEATYRLSAAEGQLRTDVLRTRFEGLRTVRTELMQRMDVLQVEASEANLSVPEQREALLRRVKSDNETVVASEKQKSDLRSETEKYRRQLQEMQTDIEERKGEAGDGQKYEILFAKDQEMSTFIEGFDESKASEMKKLDEKQKSIVELLNSISRMEGLKMEKSPESQLLEVQEDLAFKTQQLMSSESTQNRLEAELSKRAAELEKIESLDSKISQELEQAETTMRQYQSDIDTKFNYVEDMRGEKQQTVSTVHEKGKGLEVRLGVLKKQIGFLKLRLEGKRQQLADDETYAAIGAQEQKIRQFEQNCFHLNSFIAQKTSESNFQQELETSLTLSEQINLILKQVRGVM